MDKEIERLSKLSTIALQFNSPLKRASLDQQNTKAQPWPMHISLKKNAGAGYTKIIKYKLWFLLLI